MIPNKNTKSRRPQQDRTGVFVQQLSTAAAIKMAFQKDNSVRHSKIQLRHVLPRFATSNGDVKSQR